MLRTLQRLRPGLTVHGPCGALSRIGRLNARASRYEVREGALAHTVGSDTERSYRRGDLLELRRELAEAWGRFSRSSDRRRGCAAKGGNESGRTKTR